MKTISNLNRNRNDFPKVLSLNKTKLKFLDKKLTRNYIWKN